MNPHLTTIERMIAKYKAVLQSAGPSTWRDDVQSELNALEWAKWQQCEKPSVQSDAGYVHADGIRYCSQECAEERDDNR